MKTTKTTREHLYYEDDEDDTWTPVLWLLFI